MTFTVTYADRDGGGTCLRLAGELDLSTAPELNAVIDRLVDGGERRLLVDLAELTFCDSTGIAAFVRGDNRVAADGGWLRVTGAGGRVDRVLQVTGLAEVLRYESDRADPTARSAG
ncbi:STAS domain-containing protein [Micromonospora peucetia]|uniref:Anti-sigma factor antagonist n=1 Tax=Micromonospora peucetia TaxID=47871 RepID=A0A1C6W479_9ACTN|nr:STAS domain-containing protein [Micromonospora peucetia]MCX4390345.1 STAS domain-containing protein [Micromonospora peucetia]WSA32353.1 STAS domain-containing protein [Micromonospora peucetia]SCL73214.1 anti-anti-sigma factor [Micromonospora peucetia]